VNDMSGVPRLADVVAVLEQLSGLPGTELPGTRALGRTAMLAPRGCEGVDPARWADAASVSTGWSAGRRAAAAVATLIEQRRDRPGPARARGTAPAPPPAAVAGQTVHADDRSAPTAGTAPQGRFRKLNRQLGPVHSHDARTPQSVRWGIP
jgi:hypothetical protein